MADPRAALLLAVLAAGVAAQDTREPDPTLPDRLEALEDAVGDRRMEQDATAIAIIEKLTAELDGMHRDDTEEVARSVARVFTRGRVRPPDQAQLYVAAAECLGRCGEVAARVLARAFDSQRLKGREYAPVRARIILALGRTGDQRQIDMLLEEARRSPDNEIMAAAGQALGFFAGAPIRVRRDIVKQLLITYGEVDAKARNPHVVRGGWPQDFTRQNARETKRAIQGPWNRTLTALTCREFREFPEWLEWHNANPRWERPGGR